MKKLIFFFTLMGSCNHSFSQCKAVLPFTENAKQEITDVYQFTFLHKVPQNKLDSLVKQAMYPQMIIDSAYYECSNIAPRKTIDRIQYRKIVDHIGKLKTKEAFLILNLYSMLPFQMQDDLTLFATFCSNINYFDATQVINKYYLKNTVNTKLPKLEFDNAVMAKAKVLRKQMFNGINYCQPLTGESRMLFEMQQYNPSAYDSTIQYTIAKYLNHYPNVPGYFELDSVMIDMLQLPFVHDAQWDNCVTKVASEPYSPPLKLGVIIEVGIDEFNQKKYIQRVYAVGKDKNRNSILLTINYDLDFVSRTRRQCEGIEEEIELKK